MSKPMVEPERLSWLEADSILVFERGGADIRETATHSHAAGQLLGSASGLVSVVARQALFVLPATHAVWLPPHCEHGLRSHGPFSGWTIYVGERACDVLPGRPCTLRMNALLRAAVSRAAAWNGPPLNPAETRLADVVLDEIASLREEPLGLPMPQDAKLVRIANAILADFSDARGHAEWAAWAAIPTRTLSRRFVIETGFTFTTWRQRARALSAIERLSRGEAVTTVALDLGYANVSAFIAMFRRTMSVTPARYAAGQFPEL